MPSDPHTPENPSGILPDRPIARHLAPGDTAAGGAELLTLPQVAKLCGVSPRTLWGWAKSGIAPAPLKIGKHTVRYSRSAYLAWIAGGCKPVDPNPRNEPTPAGDAAGAGN